MTPTNLNSIRLLIQRKIPHTVYEFPNTLHNAEEVAAFVGIPADRVYKTLVVQKSKPKAKPLLIMIAANKQLDLKKVAKAVSEKKVQMALHDAAEKLTGLKVGGISALMLLNKGFVLLSRRDCLTSHKYQAIIHASYFIALAFYLPVVSYNFLIPTLHLLSTPSRFRIMFHCA